MTDSTAVATTNGKKKLIAVMADKYNIEEGRFLTVIKNTVMPSGNKKATDEELAAFLMTANQYDLNPFLKQIYAFPSQKGIVPIVPIDGWVALVTRQRKYDGVTLTENFDKGGAFVSVTCVLYVKGQSQPVTVTEYLAECKRGTEPWKNWPRRMLRHKAYIQCARIAFGLGGLYDEDEGYRIVDATNDDPVRREIAEPEAVDEGKTAGEILEEELADAGVEPGEELPAAGDPTTAPNDPKGKAHAVAGNMNWTVAAAKIKDVGKAFDASGTTAALTMARVKSYGPAIFKKESSTEWSPEECAEVMAWLDLMIDTGEFLKPSEFSKHYAAAKE